MSGKNNSMPSKKKMKNTMLPIYNFEVALKCEEVYYMKH